jgi:hypothetical protein
MPALNFLWPQHVVCSMELQNSMSSLKYNSYMTLRKFGIIWIRIVNHFKDYWILYGLTVMTLGTLFLHSQRSFERDYDVWRIFQFR